MHLEKALSCHFRVSFRYLREFYIFIAPPHLPRFFTSDFFSIVPFNYWIWSSDHCSAWFDGLGSPFMLTSKTFNFVDCALSVFWKPSLIHDRQLWILIKKDLVRGFLPLIVYVSATEWFVLCSGKPEQKDEQTRKSFLRFLEEKTKAIVFIYPYWPCLWGSQHIKSVSTNDLYYRFILLLWPYNGLI